MPLVPSQVERTRVIRLNGDVARVFPLFGPLRERDWAEGWNPSVVWPADGAARERMVFVVRSPHGEGLNTTWVVSRVDEHRALIEYTVFASESVHWIGIRCQAADDGPSTDATITYTFVGMSESACARNARDLEAIYRLDLEDWENAINHYLRTGKRLSHHARSTDRD